MSKKNYEKMNQKRFRPNKHKKPHRDSDWCVYIFDQL